MGVGGWDMIPRFIHSSLSLTCSALSVSCFLLLTVIFWKQESLFGTVSGHSIRWFIRVQHDTDQAKSRANISTFKRWELQQMIIFIIVWSGDDFFRLVDQSFGPKKMPEIVKNVHRSFKRPKLMPFIHVLSDQHTKTYSVYSHRGTRIPADINIWEALTSVFFAFLLKKIAEMINQLSEWLIDFLPMEWMINQVIFSSLNEETFFSSVWSRAHIVLSIKISRK